MEPSIIDEINCGPFRKLYKTEQFVTGKEDASYNFARGYYTLGENIINECLDKIRKLADDCPGLEGFYFFHSLGGGCGSGLGSLLLEKLSNDYGKKTKITCSIIPNFLTSNSIIDPYTTTLGCHNLLKYSDVSVLFDNEALFDIYRRYLDVD